MANDKTTLKDKLQRIQIEMRSNKTLWNDFNKFHYRSAESIIEDFKPFADKYNVLALLSDTIEEVGGRVYVKATATLLDRESDERIEVTAYAREPEVKKGMDESQLTGSTSSYARKYALSGLFLLDDNNDPDSNEYHKANEEEPPKKEAPKKSTKKAAPVEGTPKDHPARVELREFIEVNGLDAASIMATCQIGPKSTPEDYENALAYARTLVMGMEG